MALQLGIIFFLSLGFAQDSGIYPDTAKVNPVGQYNPFLGVTVVAAVGNSNKEMLQKIYDELNQNLLIKQYYALLPVSSYHMTTMNLFTEKGNKPENWKEFVTNQLPLFQYLNKRLQAQAFYPHVTLDKPTVSGTIKLAVHLDAQETSKVYSLAKEFSHEKDVPVPFHITLGYLYKDMTQEVRDQITTQLLKIVNEVWRSNSKPIVLDLPKLCYFRDMQEFVSWSGDFNPF